MYQHDVQKKLKTKKRDVKVLFIVGDSGTTIKHTVDEKTGKHFCILVLHMTYGN